MEKHSITSWFKTVIYDNLILLWNHYYRHPRYFLVIPCEINEIKHDKNFQGRIVNISKSGVFLETDHKLTHGTSVYIRFIYHGQNYSLAARIVSDHAVVHSEGLGAKFIYNRFFIHQRAIISDLIDMIAKDNPTAPKN